MSFHDDFVKLRNQQYFTKPRRKRKKHNTGYYRVTKKIDRNYKQGYAYEYGYYEGKKHKSICSVDLKVLEEKVRSQGLPWTKKGEI